MDLTQEILKELLHYDKETGVFTWKKRKDKIGIGGKTWNIKNANKIAGHKNKTNGYIEIGIFNKKYLAHRLVFLYVNGKLPDNDVDHKNGLCHDNRFINLRIATTSQNLQNKKIQKNNSTGFKGVTFHYQTKKYRARINNKHLGLFNTPQEAHEAYCIEAMKLFGEFSNYGSYII